MWSTLSDRRCWRLPRVRAASGAQHQREGRGGTRIGPQFVHAQAAKYGATAAVTVKFVGQILGGGGM